MVLLKSNPKADTPTVQDDAKASIPHQTDSTVPLTSNEPIKPEPKPDTQSNKALAEPPPPTKATQPAHQLSNVSQKKVTASQGDQVDLQGKAQATTTPITYSLIVKQHLIAKMEGAPYFGSATLRLTIMKAGVAIKVEVVQLEGPENYAKWAYQKALSANPYPPFPKNDTETIKVVEVRLSHVEAESQSPP